MIFITLDGPSGSGKSYLSEGLKIDGLRVLHADDFFYPANEKKHPLAGNFNAPFFIKNILPKALKEDGFYYPAFDCRKQKYFIKYAPPAKITLLEGSYSSTKLLDLYRDLSLYLKADNNLCKKRVRRRVGPEAYKNFESRWFVDERKYLKKYKPHKSATIIRNSADLEAAIKKYI